MTPSGHDLDGVRSELRRLGYLDHRFERFLLQDALRPRQPARALLLLTAKVGLLVGLVLALGLALALAAANGNLTASPLDVVPLALHLFVPISAVAALSFLALCGVILLVLKVYHVRRVETLSLAAAVVAGAAALVLALRVAGGVLAEGRLPYLVALGVGTPLVVYLVTKLVYNGLLTLAIRFTDSEPLLGRLFSRRRLGLVVLTVAALLTLPAVVSARRVVPPPPGSLPTRAGERVLLLGVDGVLPEEVDYLLALGDLPALGRLAREGGRVLRYERKADEPPASFWTAVATGIPGPDHGVVSLDSFLPLGLRTPLARNGPLRAYWSRIEVPLGLAEYRPVLANRRRAFTFWELASRGGDPALAVNWWATFPVEPVPGLVVSHGAYQLLKEGARGTVAPEAAGPEIAALARAVDSEVPEPRLAAALPPEGAASVLERALRPDAFYREAFRRNVGREGRAPKAAALYLPGLDIAATGWTGGDVALADLVRGELVAADQLLATSLEGFGTVAVVLDPGRRRPGGEGRIVFWRRSGCGAAAQPGGKPPRVTPEAVAAGLLRALGLPQSAELPAPPPGCRWAAPPVVLAGYGEPRRAQPPGLGSREYLESLRSLGYL
jgi:hypothetical protein